MPNSNEVPLMFQAQISGRGQIQYIQQPEQSERWVDEWLEATAIKPPNFSHHVRTKEYKISWRLLSNSGQDDDFIRPVIAANGFPYYPGASMKGAFLRHCTPAQAIRYCGYQNSSETKPGILRFHGAFPQDATWKEEPLIDVVHPQENWQVKNSDSHAAFLQISLYAPTLVFGISSTIELEDSEWETIWSIWDQAIERGIGSRVSAGYGQPINHPETKLFTVNLKGQGLASQLIDKTGEFRPNMFKAALRGHTLRLFSGVTDENTAQELTKELWGGFAGAKGAVVGDLGIAFHAESLVMGEFTYNHNRISMPTYDLKKGTLTILCMKNHADEYRKQLRILAKAILRFSLLIGGFGKSSRRVDHRIFFPKYFDYEDKPMIGCQWGFTQESEPYYFPVNNINHIKNIIENVRKAVNNWLVFKGKSQNYQRNAWRECFHPENVQIWGRLAVDKEDSLAVGWFHGNYRGSQSIKRSKLTGEMGKIGRIYHRMYPHYKIREDQMVRQRGYVELLTIFPDKRDETTKQFLAFLPTSGFEKLWGV
ncbi:hypothetical protein H6F47_07255 [Sphaerospermopsis sp. FACHB-1094]|uniref:hypothetical protein n=1 Tax=Sphaerospermopsis sp. FACHB-1094 TaxID=2692861 RepID=UPI001681F39A|nr:hypothetical protein [Sphaerospermopsis sp. FACHB-1094]MBD2132237.1 hypothetical protein [Sphaerospermopsis sp. FACHB-1094]